MGLGQLWLPYCICLQRGFDKQYGSGEQEIHCISLKQKNLTEMVPKGEAKTQNGEMALHADVGVFAHGDIVGPPPNTFSLTLNPQLEWRSPWGRHPSTTPTSTPTRSTTHPSCSHHPTTPTSPWGSAPTTTRGPGCAPTGLQPSR